LEILGAEAARESFFCLRDQLFKHVGFGEGEKIDLLLFHDCMKKWSEALRIRDAYASFMRYNEAGNDYHANTPEEVNYIRVDKDGEEAYIPIIAARIPDKESYIVGVPGDAQEYLKSIGYLPKDTGLILFTETKPGNAKTIMPVTVEEGGKIALTEWLERFLHKDTEYREKYLIDTERGPVLNLEQLDRDCMVLRVMATKDSQGCERLILLKPQEQEIIRTRVEEIANPEDTVICEFKMESWKDKILSVEEAEGIYRNQYGIKNEYLAKSLARNTHDVMLLNDEEGLTVENRQMKEHFGYWTTFRILWDHRIFEDFQVDVPGTKGYIEADFKAKRELLVETKNMLPRWVYNDEWLKKLEDELVRYRGAVEAGNAKKVTLFLCNPLGQKELAHLEGKLNEWFDDLSWLKICNGKEEFEEYAKLLAGS
ncbi:MAG: hypothetical protein FGF53_04105, partial [Candidatus Brockarchaeota archaeon]|nr:hypothetical protein [Candidatus Brockarchaeota archaeon]